MLVLAFCGYFPSFLYEIVGFGTTSCLRVDRKWLLQLFFNPVITSYITGRDLWIEIFQYSHSMSDEIDFVANTMLFVASLAIFFLFKDGV